MSLEPKLYDLSADRIHWSRLTIAQIEAVRADAAAHGDATLATLARRALARHAARLRLTVVGGVA
jgi:hypothetical protein